MKKLNCLLVFSILVFHGYAQNNIYQAHLRPYRFQGNLAQIDARLKDAIGWNIEGSYMTPTGRLEAHFRYTAGYINVIKVSQYDLGWASPLVTKRNTKRDKIAEFTVGANFYDRYKSDAKIIRTSVQRNFARTTVTPASKVYTLGMHGTIGYHQSKINLTSSGFSLTGEDLYDLFDSTTKTPYYDVVAKSVMRNVFFALGPHFNMCAKPHKLEHRIGWGVVEYVYLDAVLPLAVLYDNVYDSLGKAYKPQILNKKANSFGYRLGFTACGTGFFGVRFNVEVGRMPVAYSPESENDPVFLLPNLMNYMSFGTGIHITPTKRLIEFPYRM